MIRVVIFVRSSKKKGEVPVRLRLTDGRKADIFHSTDIKANPADLEKFEPTCEVRPKVSIYNKVLYRQLNEEKALVIRAYEQMVEEGLDKNADVMDRLIEGYKNPIEEIRRDVPTIVERFRQYISESTRDGIIGDKRARHIVVVSDKLERFLTIKGQSQMTAEEFTEAYLMEFRNFLYDEYLYVDKHKKLYKDVLKQNTPKERLSTNTVVSQMKMLQTFFSEIENSDEITKSPFRKLSKERKKVVLKTKYDDPIFLRSDEFNTVLNANVPAYLSDVKDAFLVQCAFGCRIGDFQKLNMNNVAVSDEGIPYVHYLPHKTVDEQSDNSEIKTPIARFAFDIIKRTGFNFPIVRNIYGHSGYNVLIKSLLAHCKINRKVPIFNEETKNNDYKSICEVGSSKLCRKTHVDMLNKVQINMYAAGLHKTGSSAVNRYTSLEVRDRFMLVNMAFGQEEYKVNDKLEIIG